MNRPVLACIAAALASACASSPEGRPIPADEASWSQRSGTWTFNGGVIAGHGVHPDGWAWLESTTPLAADYLIQARASATSGFAELALEKCEDRYVRVYIYTVDKVVAVGTGTVADGRPDGGPSLGRFPAPTLADDSWHDLAVKRRGGHLYVALDGQPALDIETPPTGCHAWGLLTGSDARWKGLRVQMLGR